MIQFDSYIHSDLVADQVVFGWDVAVLDAGHCLIMANRPPNGDINLRAKSGFVGNERFGKLLAFALRQPVAAKYAPLEVYSLCK